MGNGEDPRPQHQPVQTTLPNTAIRVLIIDDNRSFADMLSAALETVEDIECVGTAASAAEGLARAAELEPAVVVMDIMMPGVDGIAATRALTAARPGTSVVVVSAHSDLAWIERAGEAGASAYILKGGSLNDIIEGLRSARPGAVVLAPKPNAVCSPSPPAADQPAVPGPHRRSHQLRNRVRRATLQVRTWITSRNAA